MAHQTPNSYKIPGFFIIVVDGCITRFSHTILLSETVFNSNNLIFHVLKAIADKSLFKGIGYKTKQVFIRSSYYYYCEKPICMRCTVTQLAHESVGLCPLHGLYMREFELSHSNLVNRTIKITHAHNLHVKMLDFAPLKICMWKNAYCLPDYFAQKMLTNQLLF